MTLTPNLPDPAQAHLSTMRNRACIEQSAQCGCAYCLSVFAPEHITEWWDAPLGTPEDESQALGETATCPFCGMDAVIGSASGYPITHDFLQQLHRYAF